MYGQAHAGLGWVIGAAAPDSDRRLRAWCFWSALGPDADAGAMLFGIDAYNRWHHTVGHNVFTGVFVTIIALIAFWKYPPKRRLLNTVLVAGCFASHLLTDMKFSGWQVMIFWPYSERPYAFSPNYSLGDPINTWLVYSLMIIPFVMAVWRPVTPLELISARLDKIVVNAFRKKTDACTTCQKPCNNACGTCSKPTCMKHGKIDWRFRITCPACALK